MVTQIPEFLTLVVAVVAVAAEALHWRRLDRLKHLAFGPTAAPARWTWIAPAARVAGLSLACWGFASLALTVDAKVHNDDSIADEDYRHLVLVVDASPSMHLKDAGPDGNKTRRQRASDIVESLFNRVPMRRFRITVIAVYSDAKMLLEDSRDHEVVRHIMEQMPLWHAFKSGQTDLMSGINLALSTARHWNPGSTYVVLLTDGDTVPSSGMPRLPVSVAEFLVVGVGDASAGSFIDGHQSRQEMHTLRQIANRLGGDYHNGNQKQLSSRIVGRFTELGKGDRTVKWTRREWALLAALVGSALFAFLPLALHYAGTSFAGGTVPDRRSAAA